MYDANTAMKSKHKTRMDIAFYGCTLSLEKGR